MLYVGALPSNQASNKASPNSRTATHTKEALSRLRWQTHHCACCLQYPCDGAPPGLLHIAQHQVLVCCDPDGQVVRVQNRPNRLLQLALDPPILHIQAQEQLAIALHKESQHKVSTNPRLTNHNSGGDWRGYLTCPRRTLFEIARTHTRTSGLILAKADTSLDIFFSAFCNSCPSPHIVLLLPFRVTSSVDQCRYKQTRQASNPLVVKIPFALTKPSKNQRKA